jgi:hypothetical protein
MHLEWISSISPIYEPDKDLFSSKVKSLRLAADKRILLFIKDDPILGILYGSGSSSTIELVKIINNKLF